MPRRYRHMIGLMIGFATTPAVYADADAEREVLARIVHELQAIESLVARAEANADHDSRVRFQYAWLRQDLDQVQDGIQSHIDAPRAQPRAYPPLRGDYRR